MSKEKVKAIIRKNPHPFNDQEEVTLIDITSCQRLIKELLKMANIINSNSEEFSEVAKVMALNIRLIKTGAKVEQMEEE